MICEPMWGGHTHKDTGCKKSIHTHHTSEVNAGYPITGESGFTFYDFCCDFESCGTLNFNCVELPVFTPSRVAETVVR